MSEIDAKMILMTFLTSKYF